MLLLQSAFCFSANGLTLLLVILLLRDVRHLLAARLAVVVFLGSVGFSLALLPPPLRLPAPFFQVAVFSNAATFGFSWAFCRSLLQDGFKFGFIEWSVSVGASAVVLAADSPTFGVALPYLAVFRTGAIITVVVMIGYIVWTAIAGYREDLVDARRKVRIAFILFVMVSSVAVLVLDLTRAPTVARAVVYDATTIAVDVAILLWATRFNAQRLFGSLEQPPAESRPSVRPVDINARSRLIEVMEQAQAYREPGLSVGMLADRLGLPEHRLRQLINEELGYRNFAAFLNGYRIAFASVVLADQNKAQEPIVAVAMDSGYRTLSTFNRAFKAKHGETPSAYRARMLARNEPASTESPAATVLSPSGEDEPGSSRLPPAV